MKIVKDSMIKSVLLFILICIFIYTAVTLSKYVLKETDAHIQNSTEFYFESNIADIGEGKIFEITDWDGSKIALKFNVRNYTNTLLKSERQITYEIKAEIIDDAEDDGIDNNLVKVQLMNEADEKVTGSQTLLESNFEEKNYVLNITKNDNEEINKGKIFNIKLIINSISPYTKELVSNIKLFYNPIENYEVKIVNLEKDYVILNVKVNNPEKDLKIEYDNTKLVLDKSNKIVNDLAVSSEAEKKSFIIPKGNISKGKNYEIYFIKLKNDDIVLNRDITIKEF